MAVTLYEKVESRNLQIDRSTGSLVAEFLAIGSESENVVYNAVLAQTTLNYFSSLFRSSVTVKPRGGKQYWDVTVVYSPIPPVEALAGGLEPPGGGGEQPAAPPQPTTTQAIGPGWGFTTIGGTAKIYQNLETVSITQSLEAIAGDPAADPPLGPAPVKDFFGAINVTDEGGAEGLDIVSRNSEFSFDRRWGGITLNYFKKLCDMTGTVNSQAFLGYAAGELLFLGAEGRFTISDLWQITYKFAFEPNRVDLVVSRDSNNVAQITVPAKDGWDYIEVSYYKKFVNGAKLLRPLQATVHRVYRRANFSLLEMFA